MNHFCRTPPLLEFGRDKSAQFFVVGYDYNGRVIAWWLGSYMIQGIRRFDFYDKTVKVLGNILIRIRLIGFGTGFVIALKFAMGGIDR